MPVLRISSFVRILAVGVWLFLSLHGQAQIVIEFLQQPSNAVIHPCRHVTFTVVARATEDGSETGPLAYQWQGQSLGASDWTDITGAINASFVPGPPWSSSPGKFRCKVAVREQMAVSTAAELLVDTECLRPTVVSAVGLVPQNRTVVRFSDAMDPITTMDPFNYRGGLNLEFAPIQVLIADPFTAVLEWDPNEFQLQLGQTYHLRVDLVSAFDRECLCNYIVDAQVDFMTEPGPAIEVLEHPQDAVRLVGSLVTFSANARGISNGMVLPVKFQWQEYSEDSFNWNDITGATNASYTTLISKCASVPLHFRCRFQRDYTFDFSLPAALTVVADCSTLRVVSSVGDVRQNAVFLQFSESLDPTTALDPFNYGFVNGPDPVLPAIESVHMTNASTVVLLLSSSTPLRNGSTYALSISGVGDLSDPACGCKFIDPGTVVSVPAILECMRITQPPGSLVVVEGCAATFEVAARWLDGPARLLQYQWLRDGAIIPGATNRSYTSGSVALSDQGSTFSAVVASPCQVITSKLAVLSVVLDTFAPILSFAGPGVVSDTVVLDFVTSCSNPGGGLQPALAVDPNNYSISGGVTVRAAGLDCNGMRVHLITSPQIPDTSYTVSVKNLVDRQGNAIAENTSATFRAPNLLPPTPQVMRVFVEGNQLLLQWAPGGMLQVSESPSGPWIDVPNETSPSFVTPSPYACHGAVPVPQRFYQVRWSLP